MSKLALDLTKHHFCQQHGDLTVYGAWAGDEKEPCLVLLPTYSYGNKRTPLIIPQSTAFRWNPDDRDVDASTSAQQTMLFARANGFDYGNQITLMRITGLIHDHLGDLLSIPPYYGERAVVADMFITDNATGKVTHKEVSDHV